MGNCADLDAKIKSFLGRFDDDEAQYKEDDEEDEDNDEDQGVRAAVRNDKRVSPDAQARRQEQPLVSETEDRALREMLGDAYFDRSPLLTQMTAAIRCTATASFHTHVQSLSTRMMV